MDGTVKSAGHDERSVDGMPCHGRDVFVMSSEDFVIFHGAKVEDSTCSVLGGRGEKVSCKGLESNHADVGFVGMEGGETA